MEILEIQSSSSVTTSMGATRLVVAHLYNLDCSRFLTEQRRWKKTRVARVLPLGVMIPDLRIWVMAETGNQVANASSPLIRPFRSADPAHQDIGVNMTISWTFHLSGAPPRVGSPLNAQRC